MVPLVGNESGSFPHWQLHVYNKTFWKLQDVLVSCQTLSLLARQYITEKNSVWVWLFQVCCHVLLCCHQLFSHLMAVVLKCRRTVTVTGIQISCLGIRPVQDHGGVRPDLSDKHRLSRVHNSSHPVHAGKHSKPSWQDEQILIIHRSRTGTINR